LGSSFEYFSKTDRVEEETYLALQKERHKIRFLIFAEIACYGPGVNQMYRSISWNFHETLSKPRNIAAKLHVKASIGRDLRP
jgi:hypothetical protein